MGSGLRQGRPEVPVLVAPLNQPKKNTRREKKGAHFGFKRG